MPNEIPDRHHQTGSFIYDCEHGQRLNFGVNVLLVL